MQNKMEQINPHLHGEQNAGLATAVLEKDKPPIHHMDDLVDVVPEEDKKDLHSPKNDKKVKDPDKENYFEQFIHNKLVADIFPQVANAVNIGANSFSLLAQFMGLGDGVKKVTKNIAEASVKAFMICNSVTNFVERIYSKNFLMAMGFANDIGIAGLVGLDNLYLARGMASGTYNAAEALNRSRNKDSFKSLDEHVRHVFKALVSLGKNFFSKDILKNFQNSDKAMYASVGGILANLGTGLWMLSGQTKIPTIIRDVGGVMMDVEQLNLGHLRKGHKNYFFSGVALLVGTVADFMQRCMPKYKDIFVPLTFIGDGLGRHLLRLHQNQAQGLDEKRSKKQKAKGAEPAMAA